VFAGDVAILWYAVSVKGCKKLTSVNLYAYGKQVTASGGDVQWAASKRGMNL
jgi:hypothetical protein